MLKDWITRKLTHSAGIRDTARDDPYPPSSKLARTGLIQSRYLLLLALGVAMWTGVSLASILIIDPYGVSPVHVAIAGVNVLKPKRVDVDRLIKPYEVSRHQPRSVFLGTSRIQQSIDPAVLDGTRFAPLPLMHRVKQADGHEAEVPVPLEEYRALRWTLGTLAPGKSEQVSARVRVNTTLPRLAAASTKSTG